MAILVDCAVCGLKVASDAKSCPHCGTQNYMPKRKALLRIKAGASWFPNLYLKLVCIDSGGHILSGKTTREITTNEHYRVEAVLPESDFHVASLPVSITHTSGGMIRATRVIYVPSNASSVEIEIMQTWTSDINEQGIRTKMEYHYSLAIIGKIFTQ